MQSPWSRVQFDFSGLTVLVTGGTAGIGAGIAAAFHDAGATVAITGTRDSPDSYPDDLTRFRYLQYRADRRDDIDKIGNQLDSLDVLVNNAGGTGKQPEDFAASMQNNLIGTYYLSDRLHTLLAQSKLEGGASIVNISSFYAVFASVYYPGYGAAKAGLVHLTKTHAANWAPLGIRVNSLVVGSVESRMTAEYVTEEEVTAKLMERTPIARWGTPKDVAGAALFLSSPAAAYITGDSLAVDGGYCAIDRAWGSMADLSRE
ncbi:MAG: short-chain dehydrogenase [Halioglobus sp.]|nr:short-chain dehydrogenase [Halioglobus sp.]|tara:strand:+ start:2680 stop:3459 length:780 start_codon:yes stop_codon:yes gene_type:complete